MNLTLNKHDSHEVVDWKKVMIQLFLFMILPPVIGLPYIIWSIWSEKKKNKTDYYIFFACLAAYYATINATKAPNGDQVQYFVAYNNVPIIGFVKSLIYIYGLRYYQDSSVSTISGEFMNGIYNYIGYYLTFGQYYLFVFIYTFVEYMLVFAGFYKFCLNLKRPHFPIVCGALILGFFYLYFQYLLQIQKQFFAQSIMMYVLGTLSYEGKMKPKLWVLTFVALFTHATMIWFFPFLFIAKFRGPLNRNNLLFLSMIFAGLIFFAPSIAGDMTAGTDKNALSYSVGRVANAENDNDGVSLNMLQVIVVGIPIGFITIKQLWFNRKRLNGYSAFILNVVLMLLLSIFAMSRQPIAQYRYFMMIFAFMPFVYPFAFNSINKRNLFLKFLSFVMIGWFYVQFEFIIYDFAPEWAIVSVPPVGLVSFFNPF